MQKNTTKYVCAIGWSLTIIVLTLRVVRKPTHQTKKVTSSCSNTAITSDLRSLPSVNKTQFKVPNIVHYIWYKEAAAELRFDHALSVLSAIKFIKPDAVYFHYNIEPIGKYYEMLKTRPIFKVIHREPPKDILKTVYHETDYANFDKVKILIEQGGIYLDLDVMVTSSFDPLRKYDCTLGYEFPGLVCAGIIICAKNYQFLYLWLDHYFDDFHSTWAYNSGKVSSCLVKRYKGMVHIEEQSLHRPNWKQLDHIWGNAKYPWKKNHSIHTWIRVAMDHKLIKDYPTPESIKTMNSTYGQIARTVFYGSSDIILAEV